MDRIVVLSLVIMLFFSSCAITGPKGQKDSIIIELSDNEVSLETNLESYMSRVSGVRINGYGGSRTVDIRGTCPMFVLNGNEIGYNFDTASGLVRNLKIKSVKVLKGTATAMYGLRAGFESVVEIKTF